MTATLPLRLDCTGARRRSRDSLTASSTTASGSRSDGDATAATVGGCEVWPSAWA